MKRVWVLPGGGAKGIHQLPVIEKWVEEGLFPQTIYGTSVGSLNMSGYSYKGVKGLKDIWFNVESTGDILGSQWMSLLWSGGVYNLKPLRKLLEKNIEGRFSTECVACVVNLGSGEIRYVSNDESSRLDFINAVQASAAIPFVMEPVEWDGELWVDGGVREQTPLKRAIEDGADEILIAMCNPWNENPVGGWKTKFPKIVNNGLRAIGVMEHEVFLGDVKSCLAYNKLVAAGEGGSKRYVNIRMWAPKEQTIDTLDFNQGKIKPAYASSKSGGVVEVDLSKVA